MRTTNTLEAILSVPSHQFVVTTPEWGDAVVTGTMQEVLAFCKDFKATKLVARAYLPESPTFDWTEEEVPLPRA